jgi:hypothetical protein
MCGLLALTGMDPFCESDLFDDDVPFVLSPGVEHDTESLTLPTDGGSRRRNGRHATRLTAFGLVALVALLVGGFVLRATEGPSAHHSGPIAKGHHHRVRPLRARAQRRAVLHRQATDAQAPVLVGPPQTVVKPPSRGTERPTRDEGVGTGRPNSGPPVGNMEQFRYLGK